METISEIIKKEVMDPRIGMITIIDAKTSPDLKYTTIYFTIHGNDKEGKKNARILNSAHGFFQHEIAKRLYLKYTPRIKFKYSPGIEKEKQIESLLNEENEESD